MKMLYGQVWAPVYDGEEGSDPPAGESQTAVQTASTTTPGDGEKTVPQEEVNKLLAAERRKAQQAIQRATEEAQAASKKASMTAQERVELEERLSQIRDEMLTKEELSKKTAERQSKQYNENLSALTAQRDEWQKRYTDSTIERSITDAAAANNAYSPRQIVAILGGNTRVVEVLDGDGSPTGKLEPRVRFNDRDKEGKPITLDLSPKEAVDRMKETEEYLNLFRGEGSSGAGLRSQPGGKKPDIRSIARDPRAYREAKKKGLL